MIALLLGGIAFAGKALAADPLVVAGSPGYNETTSTGLSDGSVPVRPGSGVNNSGTAVGYGEKYVGGGENGSRAVRWDAGGLAATELGHLGTDGDGETLAEAFAINGIGTVVGYCNRYVSLSPVGYSAVRWNAAGATATELGNLGVDGLGSAFAQAYAINDAGTAVGWSRKHVSGGSVGDRAERWGSKGTAATELGHLGLDGLGRTVAEAYAINDSGTAVGRCNKYVSGTNLGDRAVRWDGGGTAATELGNLGDNGSGATEAQAHDVNDAGTAAGWSHKYVSGSYKGYRAVRWDAGGTTATELADLGTDSSGYTNAEAYAVNNAGTVVGFSRKYVSGSPVGYRAVRWAASGAAATELADLGTDSGGYTNAEAYAVNNAGTAVGYSRKYVSNSPVGDRAAIWLPDASAIDLNDLGVADLVGAGTWTLTAAKAISADGFVAGEGTFDPDGAGPLASYTRLWVGQVGLGGNWLNTTGTGNTWGKGANWSTGTPAIQRDAHFNQAATYTVAFDKDQSARAADITAGDVTFALDGHVLTLSQGLSVSGTGRLTGEAVVTAGSLVVDAGGKLDVNEGALVVGSGTTFASVYNLVKTGYAGAAWNGLGLCSTVAGAAGDMGLGVVSNASLGYGEWRGVSGLGPSDTLVLCTYYGDVDLNGRVDPDDVSVFGDSYGKFAGTATWVDGDTDFDGDVDPDDLSVFADNYGKSLGAGDVGPLTGGAVPEPCAIGFLLAGASVVVKRRRGA
jgi:hypothetical protein